MITVAYGGTTVILSPATVWTDEFSWSPVQQGTAYSTTGALLVDVAVRQAGRSITLDARSTNAWIQRSDADVLAAWAQQPGIELELSLRAVTRNVIFDHDKGGFDASPLWPLADGEQHSEELVLPLLRFIEL